MKNNNLTNSEKNLLFVYIVLLFVILLTSGCSNNGDTYITENTYYQSETEVPVDDPAETPEDPVEEGPDDCQREPSQDHSCKTKLVGFKDGLNQNDRDALETAKQRCKVYYPDAPCLKKFIKKGNQTYHAVCGKNH